MLRRLLICASIAALAACTPADTTETETPAATDAASDAAAPSTGVTPASVRAMVEANGDEAAFTTLTNEDLGSGWDTIMQGVASGDQAWLDIVPLLADAAAGDASGALQMSLSEALPANAPGVLALMPDPVADIGSVCMNAAVEYAELPADELAAANAAYYGAAVAAVESVRDPALAATRTACLASLSENAGA